MIIEGYPNYDLYRQIDHPTCTILKKETVVFDVMLQNYFKYSFLDDVICELFSSGGSESIKSTFTVSIYLKKPPSVLKIILQRETYDKTTYVATKINNLKVLHVLNICTNNHQVIRRYITPQFQQSTKMETHWFVVIMSVIFLISAQEFGGIVMMTISLKLVIYQKGFIIERLTNSQKRR